MKGESPRNYCDTRTARAMPLGSGWGDVTDLDTKLRTISVGVHKIPSCKGPRMDSDLLDSRCYELVESIHEHRLVCNGEHVFVPGVCQRTKSRSMPTR